MIPDDVELLDATCEVPGCYLPNGEHSAEETTACVERWLVALAEVEVAR